jgi:hypothetical protein
MILGFTSSPSTTSSANAIRMAIARHFLRRNLTARQPIQQQSYGMINFANKSSNRSQTQCRHFSTTNSKSENNIDDGETVILYERDSGRNSLPTASFLVSSLNSIYWIW